ncbi:hypothetical protein HDU98_003992 [Podochytrium sp. JEL0797]|nr:hypothetical protein HDU98_003992 [Podochytrium sp. JEL0797]
MDTIADSSRGSLAAYVQAIVESNERGTITVANLMVDAIAKKMAALKVLKAGMEAQRAVLRVQVTKAVSGTEIQLARTQLDAIAVEEDALNAQLDALDADATVELAALKEQMRVSMVAKKVGMEVLAAARYIDGIRDKIAGNECRMSEFRDIIATNDGASSVVKGIHDKVAANEVVARKCRLLVAKMCEQINLPEGMKDILKGIYADFVACETKMNEFLVDVWLFSTLTKSRKTSPRREESGSPEKLEPDSRRSALVRLYG